ncbi:hypothetical protein T440DRAFT_463388 [Plenodomus tracheiphilus IPT5]|uniref:Heme oxygenase-like protein n=1 Tax=Plenodomus tracheiphilus IPT5 TaxID=1408161 RepID=A0A6A7BL70_9PLEO|nr:hypothetical protein T440DRAFT_463388 [Plenodomus tracheiphilus IPT5]
MFILQTTTAVLIAFLALLAYNEVQNRLAKGRSRRKDLESPGSPTLSATNNVKQPIIGDGAEPSVAPSRDEGVNKEMEAHKLLYYKLHNLEHYPEILPESRQLLLSLLSSTLADVLGQPANGILSVPRFTRVGLDEFLKAKDIDVTNRWEDYLNRRKAGGAREMFGEKEEAKWWLKQAAPVKYIDGAWLGHINKTSTPFKYRHITKNAWQVMSEELGDGDLAKNHVHVYRDLMKDIEAGLPDADSKDFIHPRHELNEARCWKAAIAQLTISLFPQDFLPEALGFNMAYESLPLHLLKTVKELRELRLNPYYFELHISIDNADSGHAAMAMSAVADYIDMVREQDGADAAHCAWRRVQAGYILAEGLPTTPESPSLKVASEEAFPRNNLEASLLEIFTAKSFVAHKIHCNSRLKIGRRSLVDWLEPTVFKDSNWQQNFLHDLGNCKPWVIKGDSERSRLVKELSWEGKMFGSFTEKEVQVVKAWIDDLGAPATTLSPDPKVYFDFTGRSSEISLISASDPQDVLVHYPVLTNAIMPSFLDHAVLETSPEFDFSKLNINDFLPLWFTSSTLLESLPSVPVRASDTFGSALIRVLRAQTGFDIEGLGVAGMDEVRRTDDGQAIGILELGLDMCRRTGLAEPSNLKEAVSSGSAKSIAFSEWMMQISMKWLINRDLLVGMAWAFMEIHEAVADHEGEGTLLDTGGSLVLRKIAARERTGLEICVGELEKDEQRRTNFARGKSIVIAALGVFCQGKADI